MYVCGMIWMWFCVHPHKNLIYQILYVGKYCRRKVLVNVKVERVGEDMQVITISNKLFWRYVNTNTSPLIFQKLISISEVNFVFLNWKQIPHLCSDFKAGFRSQAPLLPLWSHLKPQGPLFSSLSSYTDPPLSQWPLDVTKGSIQLSRFAKLRTCKF